MTSLDYDKGKMFKESREGRGVDGREEKEGIGSFGLFLSKNVYFFPKDIKLNDNIF